MTDGNLKELIKNRLMTYDRHFKNVAVLSMFVDLPFPSLDTDVTSQHKKQQKKYL